MKENQRKIGNKGKTNGKNQQQWKMKENEENEGKRNGNKGKLMENELNARKLQKNDRKRRKTKGK